MKFIKTVLLGMAVVGLMGMAIEYRFNQPEVIQNDSAVEAEIVEEEQIPNEWLEEAERAKQAVLDRKADEAELDAVEAEIEALRVRQEELQKKIGSY